jgi:hypothetical protein
MGDDVCWGCGCYEGRCQCAAPAVPVGTGGRRPSSHEEWADELMLAIENAIAYGWMDAALNRVKRYKDWKKSHAPKEFP